MAYYDEQDAAEEIARLTGLLEQVQAGSQALHQEHERLRRIAATARLVVALEPTAIDSYHDTYCIYCTAKTASPPLHRHDDDCAWQLLCEATKPERSVTP